MEPVSNQFTTTVLGAFIGWDAERRGPCHGLPVHIDENTQHFYSYWKLGFRERLAVLFGKHVRLAVCGNSHPPVHLAVNPD